MYKTEVLLPTLQSVARRLGQGEIYEGIALDTDPLVMPRGASEIEVRAKQVSHFKLLYSCFNMIILKRPIFGTVQLFQNHGESLKLSEVFKTKP